jgi:hypothetical protein
MTDRPISWFSPQITLAAPGHHAHKEHGGFWQLAIALLLFAHAAFNQNLYGATRDPSPEATFIDANYFGLPTGTAVTWPNTGGTGSHLIGSDAFASIQAGIDGVASSGTVNVAAGTYPEVLVINKAVTLLGPQAGQSVIARFAAFTSTPDGPKANPGTEAIITAVATDPTTAANDCVHIMADNVTLDGLVLDGNNPALLQTGAILVDGINTDSRRAIQTEDADGAFVSANTVTVKNNIIQNYAQRGVELVNPSDTSPATSGSLISRNLIRNFGLDGILLAYNAYSDVTSNTVVMPPGTEAGIWLQDFPNNGGSPRTMHWSYNTVTVCQDAYGGIWVNLFYAPAATLTINGNTVNAAAGVTGASDYTYGIYLSSLLGGTTVHLVNNNVGATGGQFARGISLWNLPTTTTITLSGGSVRNSLKAVSLHDYDANFGLAGANSAVALSGVALSACTVGIFIDATGSTGDTVKMSISGNTSVGSCVTGIAVVGSKASAGIRNNNATITGNSVGVDVNGGAALLESNSLAGNSQAAIRIENHGIVDAGNCTGIDVTGLGISSGGNDLSGYGFDGAAPWAIENQNGDNTPLLAEHNNFGAIAGNNIRAAFYDPSVAIVYSQVPAVLACPGPVTYSCVGDVPNGAADLSGFVALGGYFSAGSATVAWSDSPHPAGSGSINRTYTVTDDCGVAYTCDQIITVRDPNIVHQPVDITVPSGSSATFGVTAAGTPTLQYQWQQDGVELPGETNALLHIPATVDSDAGLYTVLVYNGFGSVLSAPAALNVTHPPVITVPPVSQLTVNLGKPASFSVSVGGQTPFSYQWQKNGLNIADATRRIFSIPNTVLADAANYRVTVSNAGGSATSPSATLTIICPPTQLILAAYTNNFATLTMTGADGFKYAVQGSSAVAPAVWVNLVTNTAPYIFKDTENTGAPRRFYRGLFVR